MFCFTFVQHAHTYTGRLLITASCVHASVVARVPHGTCTTEQRNHTTTRSFSSYHVCEFVRPNGTANPAILANHRPMRHAWSDKLSVLSPQEADIGHHHLVDRTNMEFVQACRRAFDIHDFMGTRSNDAYNRVRSATLIADCPTPSLLYLPTHTIIAGGLVPVQVCGASRRMG